MTWTYSASSSARDYVRLLVFDTDSTNQIFQDEELDIFLSQNSNDSRLAAAQALEALASKYARSAISYSVTGFSLNRGNVADALLKRAQALREEAKQIPFEFESIADYFVDEQGVDRSNYPNTPEDSA